MLRSGPTGTELPGRVEENRCRTLEVTEKAGADVLFAPGVEENRCRTLEVTSQGSEK